MNLAVSQLRPDSLAPAQKLGSLSNAVTSGDEIRHTQGTRWHDQVNDSIHC